MTPSIEDRVGVDDLLMAYVWAVDTGDIEAYVDTFARDATLVDSNGARHIGHAAIRAYAAGFFARPGGRGRAHFFQKLKIRAEPRGVCVLSFWQVVQGVATTGETRARSMGTCDDLCVKTADGWRFAERAIGRWNDETAPWKLG
jgi:uncharacterized protein (TIGR02246 family)